MDSIMFNQLLPRKEQVTDAINLSSYVPSSSSPSDLPVVGNTVLSPRAAGTERTLRQRSISAVASQQSFPSLMIRIIIPFILAARKHYSIDVFIALYVTPLVFEMLWARFPDRDTSIDTAMHYGVYFYLAQVDTNSFGYVVSV